MSFQDVSMGIDPFRLVHSLELLIVGIISVVLEWTFVVVQKCQRIVVIHVTDIVNHGLERERNKVLKKARENNCDTLFSC